jgi:hypothetical protein
MIANLFDDDELILAAHIVLMVDAESYRHQTLTKRRIYPRLPEMTGYFELNSLTDEESLHHFRFTVPEIDTIVAEMGLNPFIVNDNRTVVSSRVGMAMLLRRLAYPSRLHDISKLFKCGQTKFCRTITTLVHWIYNKYRRLLYLHPSINSAAIENFSSYVTRKCPDINNIWGFIDGTKQKIARPTYLQRICYSGHKKDHCLSWQAVTAPNGLIVSLFGPIAGHMNDQGMLNESRLLQRLATMDHVNNVQHSLYGDRGYIQTAQLITPFHNHLNDPLQDRFNTEMSKLRISVEHSFGAVTNYWKFFTFASQQKLWLSPVACFYAVSVLLTNIHSCINQTNQTSQFFQCKPPTLSEYLNPQ